MPETTQRETLMTAPLHDWDDTREEAYAAGDLMSCGNCWSDFLADDGVAGADDAFCSEACRDERAGLLK